MERTSDMISTFPRYMRSFLQFAAGKVRAAAFLSFIGALTEGIGLLLLLPVLQLIGGETDAPWAARLKEILLAFGLETLPAQLTALLAGFVLLIALRNIVAWQRGVLLAQVSHGFVDDWRRRIFSAMAQARWDRLLTMQHHESQHAVLQDVNRLAGGTLQILQGSVVLILIAVQLGVAFVVSPALTALVLGLIGAASLFLPAQLRRARRLGQRQSQAGRRMQQSLAHFLAGLKLVKAYHMEADHIAEFSQNVGAIRREVLQFGADQLKAQAIFQIASAALLCVTIFLGLFVLGSSPASLIVVVLLMARLSGPVFGLFRGAQQIANMLPAYDALAQMEAQLLADPDALMPPATRLEGAPPVAFENVRYAHGTQTTYQIHGLSLKIEAGQMVALLGPSGAGKTTVLDLMAGLLLPLQGRVEIGALCTADPAARAAIAQALGYVTQDTYLSDKPLRALLATREAAPTDEALRQALDLTGASKIVDGLPEGLDTMAGERGQRFSGGERQRLSLSRALLRRPKLLLLDEATSALDRHSEQQILRNLHALRGRMTIIVVTHREVDRALFDQVLVLPDAREG